MKHALRWIGAVALVASPSLGLCQDPAGHATAESKVIQIHPKQGQDGDHGESSIRVELKDGKLIVIDPSGKRQEIDVADASGVSVTQSEVIQEKDGVVEKKAGARAIIVGPDGKQTEIELGDLPEAGGMKSVFRFRPGQIEGLQGMVEGHLGDHLKMLEDHGGVLAAGIQMGRYYVGIHCEPAGETLRSQLGLDENTGLVAIEISPDSPAEKAGVQAHDVLLFADDTQLSDLAGLSKVVNAAGEEGKPLMLTLLRGGKEQRIEVTPAERPEMDLAAGGEWLNKPGSGEDGHELHLEMDDGGKGLFRMQRLGPGLIMGGPAGEEASAHMRAVQDELRKAASEMREQLREMQEELSQSRREMEELRKLREKAPRGGNREGDGDGGSENDR